MTTVTPITIARAARVLGLKPWPVYKMTEDGRLVSAQLNGRRFVALEDVERLRTA